MTSNRDKFLPWLAAFSGKLSAGLELSTGFRYDSSDELVCF